MARAREREQLADFESGGAKEARQDLRCATASVTVSEACVGDAARPRRGTAARGAAANLRCEIGAEERQRQDVLPLLTTPKRPRNS